MKSTMEKRDLDPFQSSDVIAEFEKAKREKQCQEYSLVCNLERDSEKQSKSLRCRKSCRSESIFMLYRNFPVQRKTNELPHQQIVHYIGKLELELKRIQDISYDSIYKNIEYCSGVYEKQYNLILKQLVEFVSMLDRFIAATLTAIDEARCSHIQSLEQQENKQYSPLIPVARSAILRMELECDQARELLQTVHAARIKVLKHSLVLGHDVRQEGLVWLVKELGYMPALSDFPKFLNSKEIKYIANLFLSSHQKRIPNELTMLSRTCNKTPRQIGEALTQKNHRQLSLIYEEDELSKLYEEATRGYSQQKHKYLNLDILLMAQNQTVRPKVTKYEIIYKETVRKIKKICINQIYKHTQSDKENSSRRMSHNTLSLLDSLEHSVSLHVAKPVRSDEEKELEAILRGIRYETYQNGYQDAHQPSRNPLSVIGCLVGWKKAKKIIEHEMTYLF